MRELKICTWNIERAPAHKLNQILATLHDINADIFIITETHKDVILNGYYGTSTLPLPQTHDGVYYRSGELRTSIFSRLPATNSSPTHNPHTNLAVEIKTPFGVLIVLGCIIGTLGNRHPTFKQDLDVFARDVQMLSSNRNLIIAGDFNQTFSDNYYFTNTGRNTLINLFAEHFITNLTSDLPENIDHIAISQEFISGKSITISEFNTSKTLSDHKGIVINICAM